MIDTHWNYFGLTNSQNKGETTVYSAFKLRLRLNFQGKKAIVCIESLDNWHHLKTGCGKCEECRRMNRFRFTEFSSFKSVCKNNEIHICYVIVV